MLQPKRVKYRKPYLGRFKGNSTSNKVLFGDFGLQALEASLVTSRQIEATRRVITRHVRKRGKLWIRIFPDKAITARPSESRMGQGKGKVSFWSFKVRPGIIIMEMTGLNKERSFEILKLASYKLPIKAKPVDKKYNYYEIPKEYT